MPVLPTKPDAPYSYSIIYFLLFLELCSRLVVQQIGICVIKLPSN